MHACKFNRCHGRFPVPVIFVGKLLICRGATLAKAHESVLRNIGSSVVNLFSKEEKKNPSFEIQIQRQWDQELLRRYNVKRIVDLMVERKKKLMGVEITSSEKAKHAYIKKYSIEVLPYPGSKMVINCL